MAQAFRINEEDAVVRDRYGRNIAGQSVLLARRLVEAGANGIVLFNRFYQPDLDLEELEVVHTLDLSTSAELRLPLRWISILHGKIDADLALTSGVHSSTDVLKAMMAGAQVAMVKIPLAGDG